MKITKERVEYQSNHFIVKSKIYVIKNGEKFKQTFIDKKDAVAIIAQNSASKILMVSQYRSIMNRKYLELPAGRIEKNESPEQAANRELEEETGLKSNRLISLGVFPSFPSLTTENIHLFSTDTFVKGSQALEGSEEGLKCFWIKIEGLKKLLKIGRAIPPFDAFLIYRYLQTNSYLL